MLNDTSLKSGFGYGLTLYVSLKGLPMVLVCILVAIARCFRLHVSKTAVVAYMKPSINVRKVEDCASSSGGMSDPEDNEQDTNDEEYYLTPADIYPSRSLGRVSNGKTSAEVWL